MSKNLNTNERGTFSKMYTFISVSTKSRKGQENSTMSLIVTYAFRH